MRHYAGARYAVNVADLTAYAQRDGILGPVMVLLWPVLDVDQAPIRVSSRFDGEAVPVKESVSAQRMEAILMVLRREMAVPKARMRIYQSATGEGGWKRV